MFSCSHGFIDLDLGYDRGWYAVEPLSTVVSYWLQDQDPELVVKFTVLNQIPQRHHPRKWSHQRCGWVVSSKIYLLLCLQFNRAPE